MTRLSDLTRPHHRHAWKLKFGGKFEFFFCAAIKMSHRSKFWGGGLDTVLVSFNVQLCSKQIVPWTILPVDRVNTIVLFVCQNRIEHRHAWKLKFGGKFEFFFCAAIKMSHRSKFWGGGLVWEPELSFYLTLLIVMWQSFISFVTVKM
jgi:hypothetical protein